MKRSREVFTQHKLPKRKRRADQIARFVPLGMMPTGIRSGSWKKWMPTMSQPGARAAQQRSGTVKCYVRHTIGQKEIVKSKERAGTAPPRGNCDVQPAWRMRRTSCGQLGSFHGLKLVPSSGIISSPNRRAIDKTERTFYNNAVCYLCEAAMDSLPKSLLGDDP